MINRIVVLMLAMHGLVINMHSQNIPNLYSHEDSIRYSDVLFENGMELFRKGKFQFAISTFDKCLQLDNSLYISFTEKLIKTSCTRQWLAHCYYKINNIVKAKEYERDYEIEPYNRKLAKESDSLRYMAYTLSGQPEKKKTCMDLYKKICMLDSITIGISSYKYIESLVELGEEYFENNSFKEAKETLNHALQLLHIHFPQKLYIYADIYELLADIAVEENNTITAIKYMKECLIVKQDTLNIVEDGLFISNYGKLIEIYKKAGMWNDAIELQKKRTDYWKLQYLHQTSKHSWDNYEESYKLNFRRLIEIICLSGNYKMALREIYNYIGNIDDMNTTIGICYLSLKDYDNAMKYFQKANDMFNIAKVYCNKGKYKEALKLQKDIFKEEEKWKGRKIAITLNTSENFISGSYDTYLCYLSRYLNMNGQFDSTLVYEKKHYSPTIDQKAFSHMNIGHAYAGLKKWDKAIDNFIHANNIYKQQSQNRLNAKAKAELSNCYYKTGEITRLSNCVSELLGYASMDLFDTFQELTYDERSKYIGEYSDIMNIQIPSYAYYTKSNSIIGEAYNAALTMKNALLSSEKCMRRIITEQQHDSTLNALWEELKADKYIYSKQLLLEEKNRKYNTDSLYRVIEALNDLLIVRCKEYGDITSDMKLKWTDIQKKLTPEDIAIEFLSFPVSNDSTMYVALSLRKDSKCPKMIELFEKQQLKDLSDTISTSRNIMADLIWKPLFSELHGIKNIYFAPSGVLHNIGIEYLPGMEDYNIYRLSSTRELAIKHKNESIDNTVLYGGLRYNLLDDRISVQKDSIAIPDDFLTEKSDVRDIKVRGGKEYLEQTKVEIEKIGKELEHAHKRYTIFTEYEGTEESFKELSGHPIRILHISTHGFYYTAEEVEENRLSLLQLNNEHVSYEDKQLTRSGLVMAGANKALELEEGEELPYDIEDGLLTAKEIADIDLRGLDLVVLSACQTGLGDISQGEGVFGLQRGFKKAGANSILMSLWKVDDEATQILMTQFYKNYLSGQSKRQSLLSAQKYLREYDNGKYNEPKYWAAFILLDAI